MALLLLSIVRRTNVKTYRQTDYNEESYRKRRSKREGGEI